jgi:hypothetical protein
MLNNSVKIIFLRILLATASVQLTYYPMWNYLGETPSTGLPALSLAMSKSYPEVPTNFCSVEKIPLPVSQIAEWNWLLCSSVLCVMNKKLDAN